MIPNDFYAAALSRTSDGMLQHECIMTLAVLDPNAPRDMRTEDPWTARWGKSYTDGKKQKIKDFWTSRHPPSEKTKSLLDGRAQVEKNVKTP